VVVDQPPARDDQPGRLVVERRKAVGRLGHEGAVVAGMTGDVPQALEGLHGCTLPVRRCGLAERAPLASL
jgi:hypothetical protein